MSIKIISGDILTNLPSNKEVYICQQVNCRGVMGAGLALKIRRKWPVVYQQYMEIPAWKEFLGSYQKVRVEPNIHVVNLFGQNNYGLGERQTNYAAFATALFTFMRDCSKIAPEATIRIPSSIGCGLAGGDWDTVFSLIAEAAEAWNAKDVDSEGKHPLLISGNLSNYPVNSLKSLLRGLTTTIDQYEQPQHPKAQKDAAHINKHAMHLVRLYYTAFDILEQGHIIARRDKEREELLAIRNGKYMYQDGAYAPEFFELVDRLESRFQRDVKETMLPTKPDFGKVEELLVEINKSYLRRVM